MSRKGNNMMFRFTSSQGSRGFTLLEVLVALVVISVGMLGIAVLYVEGLKAQRTSIFRTSAVNVVAEMADRIRANPTATVAYQGAAADNGCTNGVADCSAAQIAAEDLLVLNQNIANRLPAGANGTVVVTDLGIINQYVITVTWQEPGFPAAQAYSVTVQI
jgi:type IV pilus assembly protein PilV